MAATSPKRGKIWDEILDPSGDVTSVFLETERKIRVCSKALSLAFTVFAKTFGMNGGFMKRKPKGNGDGTRHMTISDKVEPMMFILKIAHHKFRDLPKKITM